MTVVNDVIQLLNSSPKTAEILLLPKFDDFPSLVGALLERISGNKVIGSTVRDTYSQHHQMVTMSEYDIAQTTARNFEPDGTAATFLFGRGIHAILAHRVIHQLWQDGDTHQALALKAVFGRAFSTDIHPAAKIGAGIWLDHGLGFVVGETAIIEEDVSIWHNVTLGSTLNDNGPNRHPKVGTGAVIGAGAMLLGDITIGAGANIAAGAIVLETVPPRTTVVGSKAVIIGPAKISFESAKGASL